MQFPPKNFTRFKRIIWNHYRRHGRTLPWRRTRNPYRILVSEVMLQQTHVERVMPKYASFLRRFPDFSSLARAPLADVLRAWQGLGYNRRALYLKRTAEEVVARHGGAVPRDPEVLARLPGIGKATAGAIAAFAFQKPVAFIETNIRRAFIHFFFSPALCRAKISTLDTPEAGVSDREILFLVAATVDRKNPREWYYALMDYGAMLGKTAGKAGNPNRRSRHYHVQPRFEGSNRQLRGRILRMALADPSLTISDIAKKLTRSAVHIKPIYRALQKESIIPKEGKPL